MTIMFLEVECPDDLKHLYEPEDIVTEYPQKPQTFEENMRSMMEKLKGPCPVHITEESFGEMKSRLESEIPDWAVKYRKSNQPK